MITHIVILDINNILTNILLEKNKSPININNDI